MHPPDDLAALRVPFVGHGTGVYDTQVGIFSFARINVTCAQQTLAHELRLVLIDFTSQSRGFEFGCH